MQHDPEQEDPTSRRLVILASAAAVLIAAAPAHAAASRSLIIEGSQAALLPSGTLPTESLVMADAEPFSTGVEHYTRTVACPTRVHHYVAKCLSLVATPPPPASTAIYDPEGWLLTSAGEQANYCAAMRLAARLIRADGATAVIAPPSPESKPLVECAARYSAEIILQAQPHEADTAEYMHVIRRASRWARSVRPLVRVDFVLSTNSKYGAGVADMVADYVAAQTYLGGQAAWWLNIIPEKGVPDADVPTAVALLAGAASGSFP